MPSGEDGKAGAYNPVPLLLALCLALIKQGLGLLGALDVLLLHLA